MCLAGMGWQKQSSKRKYLPCAPPPFGHPHNSTSVLHPRMMTSGKLSFWWIEQSACLGIKLHAWPLFVLKKSTADLLLQLLGHPQSHGRGIQFTDPDIRRSQNSIDARVHLCTEARKRSVKEKKKRQTAFFANYPHFFVCGASFRETEENAMPMNPRNVCWSSMCTVFLRIYGEREGIFLGSSSDSVVRFLLCAPCWEIKLFSRFMMWNSRRFWTNYIIFGRWVTKHWKVLQYLIQLWVWCLESMHDILYEVFYILYRFLYFVWLRIIGLILGITSYIIQVLLYLVQIWV